jgi:hypothetical protein
MDLFEQLLELEKSVETARRLLSSERGAAPANEPPTTAVVDRASGSIDRIVVSRQEEAEAWLRKHAPAAAIEMDLAAERITEAGDNVGRRQSGLLAQGLESMRRALRALADELSPALPNDVLDRYGKECRTDEGGYVSRLHLALEASRDANGLFEHDKAELDLFHQRLTKLNRRIASGVHGSGDQQEAEQLYADVWRVVSVYRRCSRTL